MKHSEAWEDLGSHGTTRRKTILSTPRKDNPIVSDIIDMLEVAHNQSEIKSLSMISCFFSRIDNILGYLIQTGEISDNDQVNDLRKQVMEKLKIPEKNEYKIIKGLIEKNPVYGIRLETSLHKIITSIHSSGISIDESIRKHWNEQDKKYFKREKINMEVYNALIKALYFQKYGKEFTKETLENSQEK